jgi:iron complex outermembrane receptor protein
MKPYANPRTPTAAAIASLLFAALASGALAQSSAPTTRSAVSDVEKAKEEEAVSMEQFTVTTGYRSPKSLDQIPGAVKLISSKEVMDTLLLTEDATAVLARTIPGYAEATQSMNNTGETLRGRVALRLFDGISQTTPLREGSRNGTFTDMGIISRVEVINGPSAVEGIGAVGGIINYISKTPTKEGSETTITSKYWGQGRDDSDGWKVGLNFAHKAGNNDVFFGAAFVDRGMAYDANGRRMGMSQSGATLDTEEHNLFIKLGHNFGANNEQRVGVTVSRFFIGGKGHYVELLGDRSKGITDSSARGIPNGAKAEFNEFSQYAVSYKHSALLGGTLNVQAYRASQAMRFVAELGGADKQDPLIAPLGTLTDQSEINSQKRGVRSSWSRQNLFSIDGLEVNAGYDYLREKAQQLLALTNRVWVPPMIYTSNAPFAQFSYTRGPVTLSGGVRHEDGKLRVDDYTTTYFRNRVFVKGGTLSYKETLPNAGIIVRLPQGWSVFGSYSKGFTLPNVGIPLRNVSVPGYSVNGILDLQAVIADNKEAGVTWHGKRGSFSASTYRSYSKLGASLTVDPVAKDFILQRRPVEIQGAEFNGEFIVNKALTVTALYSHMEGKTVAVEGGPLTVQQGVLNISPDKIGSSLTWKFSDKGNVTFGETTLLGRELNVGKSSYEKTHGYTLFNLSASYATKWGEFSIGAENLFNRYYILTWAQIDQFQNYFAGRGRVISLTHTLRF